LGVRHQLGRLPLVARLRRGRQLEAADRHSPQNFLPGHYHSPIASLQDVRAEASRIFRRDRRDLPGIDLREEAQLALMEEIATYYGEIPWGDKPQPGLRYYFDNEVFGHSDAIFLYSMMRHARPRRIVEIGSGFSSAVMLDTNDRFFDGRIRFTFVEPYPERLLSLMTPQDVGRVELHRDQVQHVDLEPFRSLEAGDIVFVDSSHVGKVGSDVNHELFEILPILASGVYVHIHDVFYPFEYPEAWVNRGFGWNEDYMVRAFLSFNNKFSIVAFNTFLERFHEDWFRSHMPLCLVNPGGSLWLQVN
jgi:predicted O-methyltransferase YrrM